MKWNQQKIGRFKKILYTVVLIVVGVVGFIANFTAIQSWFTSTFPSEDAQPEDLLVGVTYFATPFHWHLLGKAYDNKEKLTVSNDKWEEIVSLTARGLSPDGYVYTGKIFMFEMFCTNQSSERVLAVRERFMARILEYNPFNINEKVVVIPEPVIPMGEVALFREFDITIDKPDHGIDRTYYGTYTGSTGASYYEVVFGESPNMFKRGYLKIKPKDGERMHMTVRFKSEGKYKFQLGFEWTYSGVTHVAWSEPINFFATANILPAQYTGSIQPKYWPNSSTLSRSKQIDQTGIDWMNVNPKER